MLKSICKNTYKNTIFVYKKLNTEIYVNTLDRNKFF